MGDDFPQLNSIRDSIQFEVLFDENDAVSFCHKVPYINQQLFVNVCNLYDYPITIVREMQYTDKMYRDAYYIYLSHLHFDIERHCQRLALFKGKILFADLFDYGLHSYLQKKFLGTIVIRPSYNYSTEYTTGRTLLNPYKLKRPFHYLRTAQYKANICGQIYTINAFPFSNQHGDVLRCAETSVWALMEYYGTHYENYSTVLPSTILNWASRELPERSMPSDGLTYSQISGLLKTFNFEPRIYERVAYRNEAKISKEELAGKSLLELETEKELSVDKNEEFASEKSLFVNGVEVEAEQNAEQIDKEIKEDFLREQDDNTLKMRENGEIRQISLQNLFHYYVESGIPLITAVCNSREDIHHSIIVIGHDERSPHMQSQKCIQSKCFEYGGLKIIDSSSLYDRYITIDDNQYPYRSERFDHFSISQNCIVEAFIVPLYRHILLDAESAVNIIETIYRDSSTLLQASLAQLEEEEKVSWYAG